jgi:hypothetical protein
MLPTDSKNKLARYDTERGYQEEDSERRDDNRYHQEEKAEVIWSHLQNGRH